MNTTLPCALWAAVLILSPWQAFAQTDPPSLQQQAAAAAANSDWPQAVALYTELIGAQQSNAAAWYQLGMAKANLGNTDDAIAAFAKSREQGFAPAAVLFGIARTHALNSDQGAALQTLGELAELGPARGVLLRLQNGAAFDFLRDREEFSELLTRLTPCATAAYRQFDFWIGSWNVYSPSEQPVGTNTVASTLDGCMLTESWESAGGSKGFSINYYDNTTDSWTQTYRDNTGNIGQWPNLTGGLRDGAMVLANSDSPQNMTRWTWTKITIDRVRQMAEASSDGGETWQVVWDSYYVRAQ